MFLLARPAFAVALVWLGAGQARAQRAAVHPHPAFEEAPTIARTAKGSPGDALNVALLGTEEQLLKAMWAAGWYPADAVTLKSSLRIVLDSVFHRSYVEAPVSSLFVWGRRQDFAFEQPVGHDPRKRHHVRFWRSAEADESGRRLWLGAATYDVGIGLSHRNGHVTHHISPEIDRERDKLVADLQAAGWLGTTERRENFQVEGVGKNGGGDLWRTDRCLVTGVMSEQKIAVD